MTQPRALVVRGGWEGHRPVEATDLFIPFLEQHGYAVRVEESPEVYADAAEMAGTDLIVQCMTMSEISPEQLAGLRAAVAAGTGFTGWHGGIADSFRASSDYLQLVGGQFATHPSKEPGLVRRRPGGQLPAVHGRDHRRWAGTHPITAGLDDFDLETEQYWVLHDDLIDVLATTTHPVRPWHPWHRPITSPAIWTRAVGRRPDRRDDSRAQPGRAGERLPSVPSSRGECCGRPARRRHRGSRGTSPGSTSAPSPSIRTCASPRWPTSTRPARPQVAAELPGARALTVERAARQPGRADRPQPHRSRPRTPRSRWRAIAHGKDVYGEKPLAATFDEARYDRRPGGRGRSHRGLRAGHRAGHRHADRAGRDRRRPHRTAAGRVGRHGHAGTRALAPEPGLLLRRGGGPLLDMGPYYLSALVHLLGPVRSVTGAGEPAARRTRHRLRPAGRGARSRSRWTPTWPASSNTPAACSPRSPPASTACAPRPRRSRCTARPGRSPSRTRTTSTARSASSSWAATSGGRSSASAGYAGGGRGIGLLDQIAANGRPPRAGGELALHVLEAMTALLRSAAEGRRIELTTSSERPAPVPLTPFEKWTSQN